MKIEGRPPHRTARCCCAIAMQATQAGSVRPTCHNNNRRRAALHDTTRWVACMCNTAKPICCIPCIAELAASVPLLLSQAYRTQLTLLLRVCQMAVHLSGRRAQRTRCACMQRLRRSSRLMSWRALSPVRCTSLLVASGRHLKCMGVCCARAHTHMPAVQPACAIYIAGNLTVPCPQCPFLPASGAHATLQPTPEPSKVVSLYSKPSALFVYGLQLLKSSGNCRHERWQQGQLVKAHACAIKCEQRAAPPGRGMRWKASGQSGIALAEVC